MGKKWKFHKMSADLSRAFDTIQRSVLLNLMKDAGCSEDDIKLVKMLLPNTNLRLKVENNIQQQHQSTAVATMDCTISLQTFLSRIAVFRSSVLSPVSLEMTSGNDSFLLLLLP